MKNLTKTQLIILQIVIATLPLILMLLWQKFEQIHYFYIGFLVGYIFMMIYMTLDDNSNRKRILIDSIYICILGLLIFFEVQYSAFNLKISVVTLYCLFLMYRGNKQALIPQDAPNAGIMRDYDALAYKKSQRMWGRLQFGFGFLSLIIFWLTPDDYFVHAVCILSTIFFASILVWLYKSSKAAI